jgi:hypothetical protein
VNSEIVLRLFKKVYFSQFARLNWFLGCFSKHDKLAKELNIECALELRNKMQILSVFAYSYLL